MDEQGVRINKYLSEAGVCSRREADRQIEAGAVTVDGVCCQARDKSAAGADGRFQGRSVSQEEERILLAFHKPAGIVCTAEKREKNNVIDYIHYPKRIYPVGRLDKDSEGLLLLTNQGDLVNKIMRAGNMHEKEYLVTVNKPLTESFLRGMAGRCAARGAECDNAPVLCGAYRQARVPDHFNAGAEPADPKNV